MRTIEEIKANIAKTQAFEPKCQLDEDWQQGRLIHLGDELRAALTINISLERLEKICNAEGEGRCVMRPFPIGTKVYCVQTDGALKGTIIDQIVHGYSESQWQGRINADKDSRFVICHNSYNIPYAWQMRAVFRTHDEALEYKKLLMCTRAEELLKGADNE